MWERSQSMRERVPGTLKMLLCAGPSINYDDFENSKPAPQIDMRHNSMAVGQDRPIACPALVFETYRLQIFYLSHDTRYTCRAVVVIFNTL